MSTGAEQRWAVVGGGMLGMTLAHRLRGQGMDVTLIEAAPTLGGLAAAWTLGDIVWDRHYHVTLLSDTALRRLLREIGIENEMEWTETRTGVFAQGKLYSVSNTLEFLRFPLLRLVDKVRLGATIYYASKVRRWQRLEDVTVSEWLQRCSGRTTFERFWLPLLRSKLGENYRVASAAFIYATIARLYAARRSGLKKEMFGYVKGGYARVLARFGKVLEQEGVCVSLGRPVTRIDREQNTLRIVYRDGQVQQFDRVVITAAAPLAVRLCPQLSDQERGLLKGIRYQGIVCASALLREPLSNFYVTNLLDPDLPFTGVIEMTSLVRREQLNGHALVYLPRYLTENDPFFHLPDEEVESVFLSALERMYPYFKRAHVLAFRVSRVKYVCPVPTLHYSDKLPPINTSVCGLHVVNSAHIVNGTLNVNETVQLAERAARLITSVRAHPHV